MLIPQILGSIGAILSLGDGHPSTTEHSSGFKQHSAPEKYIISPRSRTVRPKAIVEHLTTGSVQNPSALLTPGKNVTTFARNYEGETSSWPIGTMAEFLYSESSRELSQRRFSKQLKTNSASRGVEAQGDYSRECAHAVSLEFPEPILLDSFAVFFTGEVDAGSFNVAGSTWDGKGPEQPFQFTNYGLKSFVVLDSARKYAGIKFNVLQNDPYSLQPPKKCITAVVPNLGPEDKDKEIPSVVVDFGQVVVGYLSIDFAGAVGIGAQPPGLRLAFSESLEFLGEASDFSRSFLGDSITPGTDQIAVRPGNYTWTNSYGCHNNSKVCSDGLHGFRYVRISLDALPEDIESASPFGTVSIDSISLNFTAFLGTPETYTGWFECSDEELNQYWYDAVYTNDLSIDTFRIHDTDARNAGSPSLVDKLVIHDGAKRDRDPYVGDIAVSGKTAYISHGKKVAHAARNVLADLADHQRKDGWIPPASIFNYTLNLFDYPLYWVLASYDYLQATGDTEYLSTYYSHLRKVLDEYYPACTMSRTGLLHKGSGLSKDYGDYAFVPRTGTVTYYNALYVLALQKASQLASWYGVSSDSARWTARASGVSDAVNQYLWDEHVGAYIDSFELAGETHGQDGNSIAILAGIANATQSSRILKYWDTLALPYGNPFFDKDNIVSGFKDRVYAFISFFEIQARFQTEGFEGSAIEEIKRLYGWMSKQDPEHTFWEGISANGGKYEGGFTSLAHSWSSGVAPLLTNNVLGITIEGLGSDWRWKINPVVTKGITWARGMMESPSRTTLYLEWERQTQGELHIRINVDDETEEIHLGWALMEGGSAEDSYSEKDTSQRRVRILNGRRQYKIQIPLEKTGDDFGHSRDAL